MADRKSGMESVVEAAAAEDSKANTLGYDVMTDAAGHFLQKSVFRRFVKEWY